jgi:uncharacterized repeat protein (TIGR01451 family)
MPSRSPRRKLVPVLLALLAVSAAVPAGAAAAAPPTITKSFSVNAVKVGGKAQAGFSISNPSGNGALTGISFTDNLPSGLVVATPNELVNSCGGTVTATPGASTITFSGGSLPDDPETGTCFIGVEVQVTTAGLKSNTTGPIDSNESAPGATSNTATITGVAPPTFTKAFGATTMNIGDVTPLTFTIGNPNATTPLRVAFSDTLPAGLEVASPNGVSGSCGGGDIAAGSGSGSISLTGATVAAGAGCTFSVNVKATTAGTKNNVSGPIEYSFDTSGDPDGGTGPAASDSVTVASPTTTPPPGGGETPTPTPTPTAKCRVPFLQFLSLAAAKKKIKKAKCAVGRVTKPKRKRPGLRLVVSRSTPKAGKRVPVGTKVRLTLAYERRIGQR